MQSASPRKFTTVSSGASSPAPSSPMPRPTQNQPHPPTSDVSEAPMYQAQPLKEAVSMAFDHSGASNQISPDIVAHITEQVMNNLRLNGIAAGGVSQKPAPAAAPPSMTDSTPSIPPRDVYTPPSPNHEELSKATSHQSFPPASQFDGTGAKMSRARTLDERSTAPRDDLSSTASQGASSPPPDERTTLEKIWQPFFADDGKPTIRLGQFLRGIALHIIEDFEPRNSLVITPQKMARFYDQVRLTEEIYPWADIFGGKVTNSSISHLYRDLQCQHHFVQRQFDEKPSIPSLTPTGFQCWMTNVIQAHPEEEFVRLAKVAMDMPVSNADDRKERFPKQLSRRLFPRQPSHRVRDNFQDCVLADPAIELPRYNRGTGSFSSQASQPPPQPGSERATANSAPPAEGTMPPPPQAPHHGLPFERERKPYSAASSEAAVEDAPPQMPATGGPIERDRKPYSAQPGGGKMYESDDGASKASSSHKPRRSNTTSSRAPPAPAVNDGEFKDRSRARRPRAGSQSGPQPGYIPPRRVRSPSLNAHSNPYTRSEGGEMPPASFTNTNSRSSNIYDESDNELDRPYSREAKDERARRRRTVDMHASYPCQPKPIFDPPQYQRQQGDLSNGYGAMSNGSPYPPPPRYG